MSTSLPPRPVPDDPLQAAAWAHSSMRHDMMTGDWREYADTRMGDFFAPEVREFLPPAEISGNPALSITTQMATLYDEPVRLRAHGETGDPVPDEALEPLQQSAAWTLMQDVLESTCAMNDCLVQVLFQPGGGLGWKVARPHEVIVEPDPQQPDQPIHVRHLELSRRPGPGPGIVEWTWTTWDRRDPSAFRVEAVIRDDRGDRLEDVTGIYYPDLPPSKYPFMDRRGAAIWPWTAYHRRVTQRVMSPYAGREVWEGTLTFACLRTFWLAGVRDGAHPQRWGKDVDVQIAGTTDVLGGGKGARVVRMNQLGVMLFRSEGERTGDLGQFAPAMDPKSAGEATAAFGAELAIYAGVAPQDVSIGGGSTGQSGYAIVLSRDGQRRARRKLMVPMERGDRLRLSIEARMLNAYTVGPPLPEDPDAYRVEYADLEQTPEERRADREEAIALREAGVLGKVDFYLRWHDGLTREQAIADLIRNAKEDAQIASAIAPAEAPAPPAPPVTQTAEV